MATSSSLDEWRNNLRRMDFWLDGYSHTAEHVDLLWKIGGNGFVHWIVGVGPAASFTRAMSSIALEAINAVWGDTGPDDHVMNVELKVPTEEEGGPKSRSLEIEYQLALAVAKELGLIDQICKEYLDDELRYYTYGMQDLVGSLRYYVMNTIAPQINKKLSSKRYLLVVDNLYTPIESGQFSGVVGLPLPRWTYSHWFFSTTSRDVYDRSKLESDEVVLIDRDELIMVLILSALHQSAKQILNMICQEDEKYWHRTALTCFHYAMMLFAGCSHSVASDELIRHWAAQGILPQISINEEEIDICSKWRYIHQVGRVIIEAFQKYSLLQLPSSPSDDTTKTAIHFLKHHELVAECVTLDELSDEKELECKRWISFVDDHGRHVSRDWLSLEETSGPISLILRGCSQQSLLFSNLDHFLPKLCFLRVLDLSHSSLKSLPASIGYLLNLRLLSLRGCHDLKTLFSSSINSSTDSATNSSSYSPLSALYQLEILDMNGVPFSHIPQDMGNQKHNLIYLDMSYSKVTIFPYNFFRDMTNLEELILVKCSNLEELPVSMVVLSSLTTLEVTQSQIKYFPEKIFEDMQKLKLLKLIDNKKLISLPESISGAHGLTELHIEGLDSIMVEEIKLEGHPTLRSFVLFGAPHIRCMSLCRCRNLKYVEFKDLGALEELDLSATAIKELPSDIPNLPQLRQLLLMDVPSLKRFPWHKLQRFPDVFCLDHCAEGHGNHSDKVAKVCISDARLFYSFERAAMGLIRDGLFFRSFYVRVAPCTTNIMRLEDEQGMLDSRLQESVKKQSAYADVYSSYKAEEVATVSLMAAPLRQTERHVEISAMQPLDGLRYLLEVTKSISMICDTSVLDFYHLGNFEELEECELRQCHRLEGAFWGSQHSKNLRNVYASNLKRLAYFYRAFSFYDASLSSLKHMHFEDCPRLKDILPCEITALPCLETLDILFCYDLETIFYGSDQQGGPYQLPRLQRIRLQELPQLKHFRDDAATIIAPMWKELHVRGCWSLRRLPRLQDPPKKVKVNGERSWWGKLQWDSPLRQDNYEPKLPPEFASFNKRAMKMSYLR